MLNVSGTTRGAAEGPKSIFGTTADTLQACEACKRRALSAELALVNFLAKIPQIVVAPPRNKHQGTHTAIAAINQMIPMIG